MRQSVDPLIGKARSDPDPNVQMMAAQLASASAPPPAREPNRRGRNRDRGNRNPTTANVAKPAPAEIPERDKAILQALASPDLAMRASGLKGVAGLSDEGKTLAVPLIRQMLKSTDKEAITIGLASAAQLGSSVKALAPELAQLLSLDQPQTQTLAVFILSGMGKDAAAAAPELIKTRDTTSDADLKIKIDQILTNIREGRHE